MKDGQGCVLLWVYLFGGDAEGAFLEDLVQLLSGQLSDLELFHLVGRLFQVYWRPPALENGVRQAKLDFVEVYRVPLLERFIEIILNGRDGFLEVSGRNLLLPSQIISFLVGKCNRSRDHEILDQRVIRVNGNQLRVRLQRVLEAIRLIVVVVAAWVVPSLGDQLVVVGLVTAIEI